MLTACKINVIGLWPKDFLKTGTFLLSGKLSIMFDLIGYGLFSVVGNKRESWVI